MDTEIIKKRLAKATPRPWEKYGSKDGFYVLSDDTGQHPETDAITVCMIDRDGQSLLTKSFNADLIANAPTDLAALIVEIEELQAEREQAGKDHGVNVGEDSTCIACVVSDRAKTGLAECIGEIEQLRGIERKLQGVILELNGEIWKHEQANHETCGKINDENARLRKAVIRERAIPKHIASAWMRDGCTEQDYDKCKRKTTHEAEAEAELKKGGVL